MMSRESIIIAAWYFPPDGGAGSQRPASLARELPPLGWRTTVVTRSERARDGRWETSDVSLLDQVGEDARIVRANGPSSALGLPSDIMPGLPDEARSLGSRLLDTARRERPSVILLTMSPFFLSTLIEPLRSTCDARIVVDLRDPWALDLWPAYRSRRRFEAQLTAMIDCLQAADGVVMNTTAARDELMRILGDRLPVDFPGRVGVVENGFTRGDFTAPVADPREDLLEIVHVGTFHCEHLPYNRSLIDRITGLRRFSRIEIDRTGRTPHHLLEAARIASEASADFDREVRFRFIGDVDAALERCIRRSGIASRVRLEGLLPHDLAVRAMREAGALFLPGAGLPGGAEDLIVPGKTYEYLASGRPILAALPSGDGRRILERAGGAYVCDPCDPGSIVDRLTRLHADWRRGLLGGDDARDMSFLDRFDRAALAARLDAFLRGLPIRKVPRAPRG